MANTKEDIKKQVDPSSSIEEIKKQAATYEELKKKVSSIEEINKENNTYEDLKKQIITSYPDEITFSTQLRTLREKVNILASNPNSNLTEIEQCITAITFFEHEQAKRIAELKKESQKTPGLNIDNQSILQTSSVRKKDSSALDLVLREPELQKSKQCHNAAGNDHAEARIEQTAG
jgi:hypothetical protein